MYACRVSSWAEQILILQWKTTAFFINVSVKKSIARYFFIKFDFSMKQFRFVQPIREHELPDYGPNVYVSNNLTYEWSKKPQYHSLTNIFLNPKPSNLATTPLNKVAESSDISVLDPKLNFDDFESLCLTFSILVYYSPLLQCL